MELLGLSSQEVTSKLPAPISINKVDVWIQTQSNKTEDGSIGFKPTSLSIDDLGKEVQMLHEIVNQVLFS